MALVLLILAMLFFAGSPALTVYAGTATGLDSLSYTVRQGWVTMDSNVTVSSSTNNWTGGYLDIAITSGVDVGDQLRILSSGSLSVDGDAVSWGGTRIGTIDPVRNGVNGNPLRINFSAALYNSNFETGNFDGWTVNTSFPGLSGDTPNSITQTAQVQSGVRYEGTYAAMLNISGGVTTDCGTAHGPEITSSVFYAQAGDTLSLRWNAVDSGDDYDVYGYLVNASNGAQQQLFYGRGDNTGGWVTLNATVGSSVCSSGTCGLRFRFLAGTYDATCGRAVGSTMYVDGISVVTATATDAAVDYILETLQYQNTSNTPNLSKAYTVTLQDNTSSGTANANITLTRANTTTTITGVSPEPSVYGQNYTVSVNVAAQAPSIGTPNGSVNISDGLGNSCTANLSGGSGSCSLPSNSLGSRTLTASYAQTTGYNASSDTDSHTVNRANTSLTITDTPDPSVFGQNYTAQVNVAVSAPGSGTATGTVALSDGLGNTCNITLSSGQGSCALPSDGVGNRTLSATYAGDANLNGSSNTNTHTVNRANTTTTITSDLPDPTVYGQDYTVNVTVVAAAPGSGTPTGTVAISDGAGNSCNAALSDGAGSCTLPSTQVGGLTLAASYPGDTAFNASSDTEGHTVNKASTTTTIDSDLPDPTVYGQNYAVSVTVAAAAPSSGTPTGSVAISDGNGNSCNATLTGGAGSCTLPSTFVGTPTLTASYSGNTNFNASNDTEGHTIDRADSATTITSDLPDPTVFGQNYTVSVSVAAVAPGAGVPEGAVTVADGNGNTCNVTLSEGEGSCVLPSTLVGTPTLTATYAGNTYFNGSFTTEGHTIDKADTTTSLSSTDTLTVYGQSFVLNTSVSAVAPGSGTPTGSVQIYVDGAPSGSAVELVGGAAQVTMPATLLLVGEYEITAVYQGDAGFNGSTSPVVDQTVERASTTVVVQTSKTPSIYGESLTMTMTVTADEPSEAIPAGAVQLYVDGIPFGTPLTLDANGQASKLVPYLNLWPGTHTVTAVYAPTSAPFQFNGSDNNASPLTQVVNKASPVFTITSSPENPIAMEAVAYTVTVGPSMPTQGTPSGTVQFYVDGAPFGSPVTLDAEGKATTPSDVTLGAGNHAITVGYSGDDYFLTVPTSPALEQAIQPAPTTTQILSIDPTESVVGQPVTVAVQVSANAPSQGYPGGTVVVSNGTDTCEATLDANGMGSCELEPTSPTLPGEPVNLTATYGGSANYLGGTSEPFVGPSVDKAAAVVNITGFDPASPLVGQPVTIQFNVAPVAPGWGTPTGTVTITDGNGAECTVAVSAGECTMTFMYAGPATINVSYSGDANFYPTDETAMAGPTVTKASTALTVESSSPTAVYGQPISFTATISVVAPGSGTPTGMVQFKVDGANFGEPVELSGNQAVSGQIATLSVNSHTFSAEYLGDANFAAVSTSVNNQTVIKADTSISLVSNLNPSPYGIPVLVTATVTANLPSIAVPQNGTVQFVVDGVNYGAPVALNSSGQASKLLPYTALWVGSHNITAIYSGSANFNGSSTASPLIQVVEKGDLTITLETSLEDPVFGQAFTLSSTVIGNGSSNPVPTGTLQFVVDGVNLGSPVSLNASGTAISELISNLAIGSHTVRVEYSGDDYYVAKSVEIVDGVVVSKASSLPEITGFTPSDAAVVGEPITVSFQVSAVAPSSGTPTGEVTISNGIDSCTATLVDGAGSCQLTPTAAGPTSFTIEYAGDANFNGAMPDQPVSGPTVGPASTSVSILSVDPENVVVGQPYLVTVQVSAVAPSTTTPSGTVTISNGVDSCEATVQPDGTASCQIIPTQAGAQSLTASFAGGDNYSGSTSDPTSGPSVAKANTLVSLVSGMNPSLEGGSVSFTATVHAAAPGSGTPTGMVQFKVDGVDYGAPVALTNGVAVSPNVTGLSMGAYAVSAEYLGDDNYNGSLSAAVTQRVLQGDLRVEVTPEAGGQISYTTTENGVPVSVVIDIPAGAVDENTVLIFHRIQNSALTPLAGMDFAMNFTLEAYVDGELVTDLVFHSPATVTVQYNHMGWFEDTLIARAWDGSAWSETGLNFVSHDLDANTYAFTLAGTGPAEFALMADHEYKLYFPVVAMSSPF